jgi:hypothetical protein
MIDGSATSLPPEDVEAMLAAGVMGASFTPLKSGWDSQSKQELRNAFARNGTIPPADYLVAELFSDTLVTPNRRHTVSPAFGSRPRFRVMNEWQKAGSGLAASNDGYWVRAVGRATDPA